MRPSIIYGYTGSGGRDPHTCCTVSDPLRHLHRCHELEAAAERAVAEQQACHAQLESLQKTLVDQQALLANKVGGAYDM